MNNHILIITDGKRQVDYNILKSFYQEITLLEEIKGKKKAFIELVDKTQLTIIDVATLKEMKQLIELISTHNPSMSFLIVQAFKSNRRHELINSNKGYGQFRILNYRSQYSEMLVESVNQFIYPQYPVGASDVAIILPVYNEEARFQNVVNFYHKLKILSNESFINVKVYFVNDGSKDRTQELVNKVIEKQEQTNSTVSNVSFTNTHELVMNTRKAGTYIDGIKTIRADVLLFVDADDSFMIEDMAKMINIIREGYYELVVGTKDLTAENRPPIRKLMSFVKRQLTKSLLPKNVYDSQTGLKAINGTAAKYILPHLNVTTGLAIDLEILHIAKKFQFRTLQLPVKCIDQDGSHIDIVKDSLQFIKNIFVIKHRNRHITMGKDV